MPAWIVGTVNGVLAAYCVFMLVLGGIKKRRAIKAAKIRLKKEMEEEQKNEHSESTKKDA